MPKFPSIPYKKNLIDNSLTWQKYFNQFKLFATSIFKWHNLPSTCNERVLELALFNYGCACLVNDQKYGALSLNATPSGDLNLYGLPIKIQGYGLNGFSQIYDATPDGNAVFVLNNKLQMPTLWLAQYYAYKISNIQEIIDTNANAQRTPYIIKANKKQELTMKNALNKLLTNEPYLIVKDNFKTDNLEVFNTIAPFVSDKLLEIKKDYESNFYTDLGVNNININKKERLITDEANANNDSININLLSYLNARNDASEKFNKMLGLEGENAIYVTYSNDIKSQMQRLGIDEKTISFDDIFSSFAKNKAQNMIDSEIENLGGGKNE